MAPAVRAIWYALIFNSNVRDFWEKAWLGICVELVLVVCDVQGCRPYTVQSNILIFHRWNMLWLSILSSIICITCKTSVSSKLISLCSDLTRNTVILLSIIILMLMR